MTNVLGQSRVLDADIGPATAGRRRDSNDALTSRVVAIPHFGIAPADAGEIQVSRVAHRFTRVRKERIA
jgi:hypothetical protein